eukprot:jgi/Botrbrau1/11354/Bobra.0038s0109.2
MPSTACMLRYPLSSSPTVINRSDVHGVYSPVRLMSKDHKGWMNKQRRKPLRWHPSRAEIGGSSTRDEDRSLATATVDNDEKSAVEKFLFPDKEELPDDFSMPIWDHLDELRERVLVAAIAAGVAVLTCFCFCKDLVIFLEAPVASQGVRFLQLSPGEFFFTTFKVAGYAGLLLATPTVLYQIAAYVIPGLTRSERQLLAPIVFGSTILFYLGLVFSYEILTPAALNFFVSYAEGAVESLWSIDQYFEFVLVLMLSTGLSFQVMPLCKKARLNFSSSMCMRDSCLLLL